MVIKGGPSFYFIGNVHFNTGQYMQSGHPRFSISFSQFNKLSNLCFPDVTCPVNIDAGVS